MPGCSTGQQLPGAEWQGLPWDVRAGTVSQGLSHQESQEQGAGQESLVAAPDLVISTSLGMVMCPRRTLALLTRPSCGGDGDQ